MPKQKSSSSSLSGESQAKKARIKSSRSKDEDGEEPQEELHNDLDSTVLFDSVSKKKKWTCFFMIICQKCKRCMKYMTSFCVAWTNVWMFVETHSDPNSVCPCVRPLKFRLTFFKLLLFEQVRFNYNQTWIIGALWEPSHYDALGGHMTRSKVIWGQIIRSSVR